MGFFSFLLFSFLFFFFFFFLFFSFFSFSFCCLLFDDFSDNVQTVAGMMKGQGLVKSFRYAFTDICWNPNDDCLYVCDDGNNCIRRVTRNGISLLSFIFIILFRLALLFPLSLAIVIHFFNREYEHVCQEERPF